MAKKRVTVGHPPAAIGRHYRRGSPTVQQQSSVQVKKRSDDMERLMPKSNCVMHLHLWLETEKGLLFGPGRTALLDASNAWGPFARPRRPWHVLQGGLG